MSKSRWISDLHWVRTGQQSRSQKTQASLLDAAALLWRLQLLDVDPVAGDGLSIDQDFDVGLSDDAVGEHGGGLNAGNLLEDVGVDLHGRAVLGRAPTAPRLGPGRSIGDQFSS